MTNPVSRGIFRGSALADRPLEGKGESTEDADFGDKKRVSTYRDDWTYKICTISVNIIEVVIFPPSTICPTFLYKNCAIGR
jgi:hypothetical protein